MRGNNPGGFAQLDQPARGEVAAIAGYAHAVFAFASQHRADLDLFHAGTFDCPRLDLVDFLVGFRQEILGVARIINVVAREPANDALA